MVSRERPHLLLVRDHVSADGVFGRMKLPNQGVTLFTIEDDWKGNTPGESCIPAGTYVLERSWYYKGGYECFEIVGVPGRSRILVHIANTEEDVKGCVGVGMRRGRLRVLKDEDTGEPNRLKEAVVSSRSAFAKFMYELEDVDQALLTIEWAPEVDPTD